MSIKGKFGRGMGGLLVLVLGLAAGGLIALSPDIAAPMVVLLFPGLLALVLDRSPGCGVARSILLFQAAACVQPAMNAWYHCTGVENCMDHLAAWQSVGRVWLAGATAWVLGQFLPLGLKVVDDYRLRHRRFTLMARREALLAEWGMDGDEQR